MSGETNLDVLLSSMTAVLDPQTYVFITLKGSPMPLGLTPRMMFEEAEGTTLILALDAAKAAGLTYEFPCRMITLNIHSALDAVGFLARIATELATEEMGVNPVSGFYHDHLFIPEGREQDALRVIQRIAHNAASDV